MKNIINLTPHPITILADDNTTMFVFDSVGVARCSQQTVTVGSINGIPLTTTTFGDVVDLPDPIADTFFIVSRLVMSACPDRDDLLVPNDLVRDDNGNIIGARSLANK